MIFKKAVLGSFFASIFSMVAFGGWSSGGGELFKDQNNPWFVKNTSAVNVCVEIDEANFGLSRAEAEYQLKQAMFFWKKNMEAVHIQNEVGIAKQDFFFGECTNATDLRVQFGVLTQQQQDYFRTPQKLVSSIVRTSYDTVNLKGKGFLYVSPQFGPLRMQAGRNSVEQPWSMNRGNLLGFVLAHELGHMFGYTHSLGSEFALMAEEFPEMTVGELASDFSKANIGNFIDIFEFKFASNIYCSREQLSDNMKDFFELPKEAKCIEISTTTDKFDVFWSDSISGIQNGTLAGSGVYDDTRELSYLDQSIYLPVEQIVFINHSSRFKLPLPRPRALSKSATYRSQNGTKRAVYAQLSQKIFKMSGALGDKMILDITNESSFKQLETKQSNIEMPFRKSEINANELKNRVQNFLKRLK